MAKYLVKLMNEEVVGFIETDKTFNEVVELYNTIYEQEYDIYNTFDVLEEEYGILFQEFDDDILYVE